MDVYHSVFEIMMHKAKRYLVFLTPPLLNALARG